MSDQGDAQGRSRPSALAGLRVLVTRPADQAGDMVERLRALGAQPVLCPTIRIEPPANYSALDRAIAQVGRYDWVIFTSVNGVRAFVDRGRTLGYSPEILQGRRLAAIGPATARELAGHSLTVTLVPRRYVAEAILEEIGPVNGQRILLPRADIARKALAEGLAAAGAQVDEVVAYRTAAAAGDLPAEPLDVATFTSPSTVRSFTALVEASGTSPAAYLAGACLACIGPITSQAVQDEGLVVNVEASEHTVPGLLRALIEYWEKCQK